MEHSADITLVCCYEVTVDEELVRVRVRFVACIVCLQLFVDIIKAVVDLTSDLNPECFLDDDAAIIPSTARIRPAIAFPLPGAFFLTSPMIEKIRPSRPKP